MNDIFNDFETSISFKGFSLDEKCFEVGEISFFKKNDNVFQRKVLFEKIQTKKIIKINLEMFDLDFFSKFIENLPKFN